MDSWNYQKAGVDVNAGYEAVRLMKPFAARTHIPGVLAGLGGFGGCFELPAGYEQPVLVSGTDSVGTKLMAAYLTGVHNTVGIDCVAMCVNDIICQGAKPLFFLDYIGIGKLDPVLAASLVEGVSEGCVQAGCALIGGETAELPGLYQPGEYDLVGFAVGVAEKAKIIDGSKIQAGDKLVGIASAGLHSNGFSLVRELAFKQQKLSSDEHIPELGTTLGKELLKPTKIYAKLMDGLTKRFTIKGAAHVTGGGWIENIPRLLNGADSLRVAMDTSAAPVPPIFGLLQKWGHVSFNDMYNTFNMGIGLVLAVSPAEADAIMEAVREAGEAAHIIGTVEERGETGGEEPIRFV